MSTDADAHKVGLIPVTLMVSGNIMGSGVFLLPANLASTGGIAIYGWLVTIIGALALSMVYAKMSSLDSSPGGSWIGPYISIHFLSLNPLLVRRRRYSRGERYPSALCGCHSL